MKHIFALGAVLALSACDAVGPDFLRPQVPLTERFAFAHAPELREVPRTSDGSIWVIWQVR